MTEETATTTPPEPPTDRQRLRESVHFFYDLQQLRISTGNRSTSKTIMLDENQMEFHSARSLMLDMLEKMELKKIERLCQKSSIYPWLKAQRGIGPTLAGVIIAEVDIARAETPSALWSYAGLGVVDGKAPRRTKGVKLAYNSWFRTKMVGVAADCMIKAKSPWRDLYDNYKTRKQNTQVEVCRGCDGTKKGLKGIDKGKKCRNCKGTGGPAPWGESDGHRHRAALRYMIKQFLAALWTEWRTLEKLEVVPSYSEAVLGRVHGDHGGMGVQQPSA